jgi:hypothetical protein
MSVTTADCLIVANGGLKTARKAMGVYAAGIVALVAVISVVAAFASSIKNVEGLKTFISAGVGVSILGAIYTLADRGWKAMKLSDRLKTHIERLSSARGAHSSLHGECEELTKEVRGI